MAGAQFTTDDYVQGVTGGDRTMLSRAITLVESRRPDHQTQAQELLVRLLPHAGGAHRVGITGVPGVGKSTFIDQLGVNLTDAGHRVAVLAVDPTSSRTGGSILGDKTRMERLAVHPNSFIRPSPSKGTLGGVTRTTRETIVVCEAAGFDVVLVETVGVGQSETLVADMVDFFLVLMLAGAGDELQGIKKGLLEMADMLAITKADGDNERRAASAAADYRNALHLLTPASATWSPPVLTCSAVTNVGIDDVWEQICTHRSKLEATGELDQRRADQQVRWMWAMVEDRLLTTLRTHPQVSSMVAALEGEVRAGRSTPTLAATHLLEAFGLPDPLAEPPTT